MRVLSSPQAVEFIRQRGGRLFVWADTTACCGGTRFIEASTEDPPDPEGFRRFDSDAFELFLRPAGYDLPDELHIDVGGRWRPKVRAYWNGCAFLV